MTGFVLTSSVRLALYLLHTVRWIEVWNSLVTGAVVAVAIYAYYFVLNWFRRHDLEEPPRRIPHRKRQKISKHLLPYGHSTYPVVSIYFCAHVADGKTFAEDIRRALTDGGWRVDRMEEADCHSSLRGVWINGEWKDKIPADSIPMSTVLKEALEKGGVSAAVENPHGWMILGIGPV